MASSWTLQELTEFDVRMHKHAVDHSVYSPELLENTTSKSECLHHWLLQTRDGDTEATRLSRVVVHSERVLQLSLWIFSLLTGAATAAAFLRYEGDRLINISSYLGVLVGGQLLLLCGLALSALLFRKHIHSLQSVCMPKLIQTLPSPSSLQAWRWKIFSSFQKAGIAFNVGVLLLTLWKVLTYDLAFGWASTLATDSQSIYRIVKTLSIPWLGEFSPTPEHIEQSRIALNTGLAQIDPASTASWWPFLMMCVVFYGLFPRILLSIFGTFKLHRQLANPDFSSPDCEKLYLNLTRKPLHFFSTDTPSDNHPPPKRDTLRALVPSGSLQLILPKEFQDPAHAKAFAARIQERLKLELSDAAKGRLKIIEAWQPPLEETLRELRELRESIGPEADILLLAVGFPDDSRGEFFQEPDPQDLEIWQSRLSEVNDSRLGILPWRPQP